MYYLQFSYIILSIEQRKCFTGNEISPKEMIANPSNIITLILAILISLILKTIIVIISTTIIREY